MKWIRFFICVVVLFPISVKAIDIYSNNGILYNLNDDKIIFEKNAHQRVQIASLTKIMTALVSIENISDFNDKVLITPDVFVGLDDYAMAGFKIGDEVTYKDLLYGLMLPSGAECAYTLAINISGSVFNFVDLMNQKAIELGLENTHFQNPIGMDDVNNYSSVFDIAKLLRFALDNPIFYDLFTTKEYVTTNGLVLESTIKEKGNYYNLDVSSILGSKTGFTDWAGYCLASIAKINDINYLFVTTKANTNQQYQVIDAINVYNYYSKNYGYKKVLSYNQLLSTVKIRNSFKKEYNIYSDIDKYLYLNNDVDVNNLSYYYDGVSELTHESLNDYIGKVSIVYDNEVLYSYDVYLNEKINYINYPLLIVVFFVFLLVIFLLVIYSKRRKR
ncbi:MAG: D-alanyl-D-alanine carboxypeptidase [Bacilli bacterium]|nr:D-alanyl-D-alanine carboxypeptidase [Bacilli bacterium]